MARFILGIDAGTTGVRAVLFDAEGRVTQVRRAAAASASPARAVFRGCEISKKCVKRASRTLGLCRLSRATQRRGAAVAGVSPRVALITHGAHRIFMVDVCFILMVDEANKHWIRGTLGIRYR